jgi:hypothetical protein
MCDHKALERYGGEEYSSGRDRYRQEETCPACGARCLIDISEEPKDGRDDLCYEFRRMIQEL